MKKFIISEIGSSFFSEILINQFDDVKIEVISPIYEDKKVEKINEETGSIEVLIEKVKVGEEISYTLPDGSVPNDIDSWQSRKDPTLSGKEIFMTKIRPDGDYIANINGEWVFDASKVLLRNTETHISLMKEANTAISTLQDAFDLDMQEAGDEERLKEWKKYRILLSRVDLTIDDIVWPEKPS